VAKKAARRPSGLTPVLGDLKSFNRLADRLFARAEALRL